MSKKTAAPGPISSPRSAGVLLHVTSLPSPFGIGDLGPGAYRWIDALARAKQTWWQILPLNPPDGSNSPYSARSAFAGNVLLISPELLVADGLLRRSDLSSLRSSARSDRVDFDAVNESKWRMIAIASDRFRAGHAPSLQQDYDRFVAAEAHWLEDDSLFAALRDRSPETPWTQWPKPLLRRAPAAMAEARRELAEPIERHRFAQFIFHRQLDALRAHARERGVKILGDVPIYVSGDSSDVWANARFFQLDANGRPKAVAGVPPDLFSKTGQRWGNPLYDWAALEADGFAWWIARLQAALRQADVIRIDHFRALAAHWRIPANAPTAERGRWVPTPGEALLRAVAKALNGLPLVAEDLGVVTPDVEALRDGFGLAGMQILQFGFADGNPDNLALAHNHVRNAIVYPGNHDNDTCVGWFHKLRTAERRRVERYVPGVSGDPAGAMIRLAMTSVADRAIVAMQDVLALGSDARMNTPGIDGTINWRWRMSEAALRDKRLTLLAEMTETFGRAQNGKL